MRYRLSLVVIALIFASTPSAEPFTPREDLPALKLRGYGVVSARLSGSDDASTLAIQCESTDKARLLQAKYLSDLELLPGVNRAELQSTKGPIEERRVVGQGCLAAIRIGDEVRILAATTEDKLRTLAENELPDHPESKATADVPMYLDRWDRFGFRFYYAPWMRPRLPNGRDDETYDPLGDFKFAQDSGRSGIVLWNRPNGLTGAEGITNVPGWDWALREAAARKLPIGINFDIGVPHWIFNRYPEQVIGRAPQYAGTWYGLLNYGNPDLLSWASPLAQDVQLAQMQKVMRGLMPHAPTITSWLEMHGELSHPPCELLTDFGPEADRSFQAFLKKTRYASIARASAIYAVEEPIESWQAIRAPEVADFYGLASDAVDLRGTWKINFDAPFEPASAAPALDDSKWPTLTAPGDQIISQTPHKPAVFRRTFHVDAAWLRAHEKAWLYIWDLNDTRSRDRKPHDVFVYLNGQLVPELRPRREEGHWAALDVSPALHDGDNSLTLMLPSGCLLYRTYLSGRPPLEYPSLGPKVNQRWADFVDWVAWMRAQTVRRGAQAIRQIDPDRPIVFMAPTDYAAGVKQSCQDYGGVFHDTGSMAGFWTDQHVMQMSAAGLPSDCEPGSGATDEADFKRFMGRWITEGTQGVDYFIHIGDVMWKPDVRVYFAGSQHLWHLIGKYHSPQTQVATLNSDRVARLTRFPWGYDPNTMLRAGHWQWRVADLLHADYTRDMLDETDFALGGNAGRYRVVIDANTTVIDPPLLEGIERFVREGGTFVTYVQTGRHTSADKDAWPIAKLTGYAVTHVDAHDPRGRATTQRALRLAPGQDVFQGDWEHVPDANGLSLQKQAADCRDLLLWPDGTVAAGMRPLGKGVIINLGVKFTGDIGNGGATGRMFEDILRWANVPRTPATARDVRMSHFVSNNGLYDVWALFNEHPAAATTDITFRDEASPAVFTEVTAASTGPTPLADGKIGDVLLGPWETRVFLTPRQQIKSAPLAWLNLQRGWWRGTTDAGPPVPPLEQKLALDLTEGWSMSPLDDDADASPMIKPEFDDSKWEKSPLRIVSVTDHAGARHALFRRKFRVPEKWNAGAVSFWCQVEGQHTMQDAGRLFIDGREAWSGQGDGPQALGFDGILRPNSEHVLAIEVRSKRSLVGVLAGAWLAYVPDPLDLISLAGAWETSDDPLRSTAITRLPGTHDGTLVRRTVHLPDALGDRNVVFHVLSDDQNVRGLLVNGRWLPRETPYVGKAADFNVTPFVKPGDDNAFLLVNARAGRVREVTINLYRKGEYP